MADFKKWVLMIQPTRAQGLIWQAVLKSQGISVIWESADANVIENIEQLSQAGLALPDLLLIDIQLKAGNAYDICRWCHNRETPVKVILTDCSQTEITDYERRWAIYQGAVDFLPAFQRENLVSTVAAAVKRVLEVLDEHPLNHGALISILLSMKRQIEAKDISLSPTNGQVAKTKRPQQPEPPAKSKPVAESPQTLNGHATKNGHTTNGKEPQPEPPKPPRNPKLSYRFGKYPKQ